MSNSSLAKVTVKSPNHSGRRAYRVERITPHCMVGQMTAKSCGTLFSRASYQASSNYGIGAGGEIGLYVDEKNRSWCTSSADNDNRAITIECASDTYAPYAMNSRVYTSLVNLCVDICKRYGKAKLLWPGSKAAALAYKPKDDEMILTAHRWFAAKSCPGDWLYSRLGKLAVDVTKQLRAASVKKTEVEDPNIAAAAMINNEESDRAKIIWDFLRGKGLNVNAAAGLMGNLYAESALRPNNLQNSFERRLGMTDKGYTTAVNTGSYKNFVHDGAGYGLAQWTWHTRKQALLDYARKHGKSIDDMQMQLDFLWGELQDYTKTMTALKEGRSIQIVSDTVLTDFEKPADQSSAVKKRRADLGREYRKKYGTKTAESAAEPEKELLYCVQFGAYRSKTGAKQKAADAKKKGFDAVIVEQEDMFKVQLGAFTKYENAEALATRAKRAGFSVVVKSKEA